MKIGIWGSLNYGNFGDDVMNVAFGLELKKLGFRPYLYRLDKSLAEKYGLNSAINLDELLEDATFSFIGGGSWLESRKLGDSYESDFEAYLEKLIEYDVPYYAISIGGDSKNDSTLLTQDRIRLFSHPLFKGGTVRLKGDMDTMLQLGKKVEHYPDIVLSSASFFLSTKEIEKKSNGKFKIGICATIYSDFIFDFVRWIERLPFLYKDYEIIFIQAHLPDYGLDYEYKYEGQSRIIKNKQYEGLHDFYSFVNELDVVIASKLHPGVAALSCGVPYIWCPGFDKTRTFLKTIGIDKYEYSSRTIFKKILTKRIRRIIKDYNFAKIEEQKALSKGHLEYLRKITKKHLVKE